MRKNSIVIKKSSLDKLYKSYYIVKAIERKYVYCVRCSINKIAEYTYVFNRDDIIVLTQIKVQSARYIEDQLNRKLILGMKMKLYLKITEESIELLKKDAQILCIYKKLNGYTISKMYKLFKVELVYIEKTYASNLAIKIKENEKELCQWIKVKIGTNFQKQSTK